MVMIQVVVLWEMTPYCEDGGSKVL